MRLEKIRVWQLIRGIGGDDINLHTGGIAGSIPASPTISVDACHYRNRCPHFIVAAEWVHSSGSPIASAEASAPGRRVAAVGFGVIGWIRQAASSLRSASYAMMVAMALKDPSFTIGIEEEYLLVDRASRDLVREMPQALFEACEQALRGQVAREFLKSQIEVETRVHRTARDAGRELRDPAGDGGAARRASTGWRRSPPPRIRSRAGARSSRPSASAIRPLPRTSPASAGGSSSAACTCTSASRTTSCASI